VITIAIDWDWNIRRAAHGTESGILSERTLHDHNACVAVVAQLTIVLHAFVVLENV